MEKHKRSKWYLWLIIAGSILGAALCCMLFLVAAARRRRRRRSKDGAQPSQEEQEGSERGSAHNSAQHVLDPLPGGLMPPPLAARPVPARNQILPLPSAEQPQAGWQAYLPNHARSVAVLPRSGYGPSSMAPAGVNPEPQKHRHRWLKDPVVTPEPFEPPQAQQPAAHGPPVTARQQPLAQPNLTEAWAGQAPAGYPPAHAAALGAP